MGNENHGDAELFAERTKHAEDFHLGYGIESSGRLVGDYDGGIAGDGLGDESALPLAAAELVWVGAQDAVCLLRKELAENLASPLAQIILV